ncbi:unnamed protein product [Ostreobium quekettii]|uniref:CREG-like beta-barrel domain-containing protein n=1 Tax=Ostreobium quekettii TaxID=121088 RepID=A0A8S1IWM7_9CHLO|nr:unnamed protein product [Ostreobium quekettii]
MPNYAVTADIQTHENVTVTLSEAAINGHCTYSSGAEYPLCVQTSLTGPLRPVPDDQVEEARALLFARFPAMANWPRDHGFQPFEVHIEHITVQDFFGGDVDVSPSDYFAVKPSDFVGRPLVSST